MSVIVDLPIGVAAGLLFWSLAEYLIHRFDGHQARGRTHFSREHLAHHALADHFAPTGVFARAAVPVALIVGLALTLLWSSAAGLAAAVAFLAGCTAHEWLHRRFHARPPRTRYGRWARKHHFHHHFKSPRANHGVTSPLWDWVFGTLESPERVAVPESHAMPWLAADARAWARDFELVPTRRRAVSSRGVPSTPTPRPAVPRRAVARPS